MNTDPFVEQLYYIEELKRENIALRRILLSHGEIIEQNAELRKTIKELESKLSTDEFKL